jgi:hypothetical protein
MPAARSICEDRKEGPNSFIDKIVHGEEKARNSHWLKLRKPSGLLIPTCYNARSLKMPGEL